MKVELEQTLPCPPEVVRKCLLSRPFWDEFLLNGEAIDPEIELDDQPDTAHVQWKVAIPGDVPKIVRSLVGNQVRLDLRLPLKDGEEWRLDLDAHANATGRLRTNLMLEPHDDGCTFRIDGSLTVNTAVMSGTAEKQVWREVLRPLLLEEMLPLIERCCAGRDWPNAR